MLRGIRRGLGSGQPRWRRVDPAPYETQTGGAWYAGTADAITQNLDYIKANDPKYVLILSGDHLYRMDYRKMLKTHIENNADLTVSVMPVPWEEAAALAS